MEPAVHVLVGVVVRLPAIEQIEELTIGCEHRPARIAFERHGGRYGARREIEEAQFCGQHLRLARIVACREDDGSASVRRRQERGRPPRQFDARQHLGAGEVHGHDFARQTLGRRAPLESWPDHRQSIARGRQHRHWLQAPSQLDSALQGQRRSVEDRHRRARLRLETVVTGIAALPAIEDEHSPAVGSDQQVRRRSLQRGGLRGAAAGQLQCRDGPRLLVQDQHPRRRALGRGPAHRPRHDARHHDRANASSHVSSRSLSRRRYTTPPKRVTCSSLNGSNACRRHGRTSVSRREPADPACTWGRLLTPHRRIR